jgi:3-methyladenine DNA glycosylase AlkC
MGTLLKDLFSPELVAAMADNIALHYERFDRDRFFHVACHDMDKLELKQRSNQVLDALSAHLPREFSDAATIIVNSLAPAPDGNINDITDPQAHPAGPGIRGWGIMPMADYIARHGQDNVELSMDSLYHLTQRFTAEFAIRPFLMNHTEQTLAILAGWINDPNVHVRRLISEGTRPRLPWGIRLPAFVQDPSPIIVFLTTLRGDRAEYVRRSVANSLNDISKDHPDRVASIAKEWLQDAPETRQRIIRHACRSLLKQGHGPTLDALGIGPVNVTASNLVMKNPVVQLGGSVEFSLQIKNCENISRDLMIDYAIHHRKANGSQTAKVFKWKKLRLKKDEQVALSRRHPVRAITTRKYYAGMQRIEIMVNGHVVAQGEFDLQIQDMTPA